MVKNYIETDLTDLDEMKTVAREIAAEIKLAHSSAKALKRIEACTVARRAVPHFKAIVSRYYRAKANQWLDENGYKALPPQFDKWEDIAGAAQAHVMQLAGIEVELYNGYFIVTDWS